MTWRKFLLFSILSSLRAGKSLHLASFLVSYTPLSLVLAFPQQKIQSLSMASGSSSYGLSLSVLSSTISSGSSVYWDCSELLSMDKSSIFGSPELVVQEEFSEGVSPSKSLRSEVPYFSFLSNSNLIP